MDFSAWFQVWLDGRWFTFDARHNVPRIGRILMATGRDATDVALSTSFGSSTLVGFRVVTDEVPHAALHALRDGPSDGYNACQADMPAPARMAVFAEAVRTGT